MVWSWSVHIPISFYKFVSVIWVVFFGLVGRFLVGFSNSWVFFCGCIFLPEIGVCISLIVLWLVLLIGVLWSLMLHGMSDGFH